MSAGRKGSFTSYTLTRLSPTTATFPSSCNKGDELHIPRAVLVGGKLFEEGQTYVANTTLKTQTNQAHWDLKTDNDHKVITINPGVNPLIDAAAFSATTRSPQIGDWAMVFFSSYDGSNDPVGTYADASDINKAAYVWVRFRTSSTAAILPEGKYYFTGNVLGDQASQHGLGGSVANNNYFLTNVGEIDATTPGTVDQMALRVAGTDCCLLLDYDR